MFLNMLNRQEHRKRKHQINFTVQLMLHKVHMPKIQGNGGGVMRGASVLLKMMSSLKCKGTLGVNCYCPLLLSAQQQQLTSAVSKHLNP